MKKILMTVVMAAAFLLPAMAQSYGTQSSTDRQHSVAAPAAGFRSTSVMSGSGSAYSSNPSLNTDGTASYNSAAASPAKAPGGPHRAPDPVSSNDWWSIPGNENEKGFDAPLGDALIPLLLMVMVYAAYIFPRRKRA